jgi:cytochrome c oxidase assembly protein subunit 11
MLARISGKAKTVAVALLVVLLMSLLAAYSSVLYKQFCQATGFGGTTGRAQANAAVHVVSGKTILVSFDANTAPNLPWAFKPEQPQVRVTIGAKQMVFFTAENRANTPITGQAGYNVAPDAVGRYFKKIQCFCFNQQTLQPHEKVRMPVLFYVDPAILDNVDTKNLKQITLSYTFYPIDLPKKSG